MARVAISIVRRADFERTAFTAWLERLRQMAAFPAPATVPALRSQQNTRHLLTALFSELSVDPRPSDGADFARQSLRDALKPLF